MKKLLILIVSLFLLVGCGAPDSGKVIEKSFKPAHNETRYVQQWAGQTCSGNPQICTPVYITVPQTYRVDDKWRLKLQNGEDEGWVTVTKHQHDEHSIGDWYGDL